MDSGNFTDLVAFNLKREKEVGFNICYFCGWKWKRMSIQTSAQKWHYEIDFILYLIN